MPEPTIVFEVHEYEKTESSVADAWTRMEVCESAIVFEREILMWSKVRGQVCTENKFGFKKTANEQSQTRNLWIQKLPSE